MPNVNTLLDEHVVLKYEFVDRIFVNGYVARFQEPDDLSWFLCRHRGEEIPRYEVLGEMTRRFVAEIEKLAESKAIPVVQFEGGQRKEAIAQPYFERAAAAQGEGVVMIGVAQEKANVFRPPSRNQRVSGKFGATRASAYVKHFFTGGRGAGGRRPRCD